jgi:hypothetical protein
MDSQNSSQDITIAQHELRIQQLEKKVESLFQVMDNSNDRHMESEKKSIELNLALNSIMKARDWIAQTLVVQFTLMVVVAAVSIPALIGRFSGPSPQEKTQSSSPRQP